MIKEQLEYGEEGKTAESQKLGKLQALRDAAPMARDAELRAPSRRRCGNWHNTRAVTGQI